MRETLRKIAVTQSGSNLFEILVNDCRQHILLPKPHEDHCKKRDRLASSSRVVAMTSPMGEGKYVIRVRLELSKNIRQYLNNRCLADVIQIIRPACGLNHLCDIHNKFFHMSLGSSQASGRGLTVVDNFPAANLILLLICVQVRCERKC